jgi:hypothetical protein
MIEEKNRGEKSFLRNIPLSYFSSLSSYPSLHYRFFMDLLVLNPSKNTSRGKTLRYGKRSA